VWFGGHHERTLERIAKSGDGWMPNAYPPDQSALDVFARLRSMTEAAGRDPAGVGSRSGLRWFGDTGRLGRRSALLESGRRLASVPDHDIQPAPPPTHYRAYGARPPGRAAAALP